MHRATRRTLVRALGPALALLAATGAAAQQPSQPALRAELLRLGREDQAARDGFGAAAQRNDTLFMRRLVQGDSARTLRLKAIVREHGWPGRALVGADGAGAAWLLLQHSVDYAFQREMLPVLWSASERGEVAPQDVAMLTDRVLVHEGLPQHYGNSFSVKDGRMVADPIDDPAALDARRAKVGLPPMAEYVRVLGEVYGMPVEWPPASR